MLYYYEDFRFPFVNKSVINLKIKKMARYAVQNSIIKNLSETFEVIISTVKEIMF